MVHQHFMLVPTLTVAENYAVGRTRMLSGLSLRAFVRRAEDEAKRAGLPIDPTARVADLSVGQQQRVEIVRALGRGARLLILDEPTAVLTPQESRELMQALRRLAADGTSVVFISHKLREVMEISDRISVLRAGRHVRTVTPDQTNEHELALLMIGRDELRLAKRETGSRGSPVLRVRDLHVRDDRDHAAVRGVTFDVHSHEILGVAGVDGNGQTELSQALIGLRKVESGSIEVGENDLSGRSPAAVLRAGVGYVSEDRQVWGLFPDLSIAENLISERHSQQPFSRHGLLQAREIRKAAEDIVRGFDIRPPQPGLRVGVLSGGNKQKVVIARTLAKCPSVLVINQPTRGVDVGASEYIRQRILEERGRGAAILLVSADLDEILLMSDRIAVMFEGRLMATIHAEQATPDTLGLLMAGRPLDEAAVSSRPPPP
jgi:simple sugar transport system ATP-binding protein